MHEELVRFYDGPGVEQIWSYDHERLESVHDYIQWLFPTRTPSRYHPSAPLLDEETVELFARSPRLRERLLRSLAVMLQFFGLQLADGPTVDKAPHFASRFPHWSGELNHNLLRLTRILESLRTLGCAEHALALFRCLEELQKAHPKRLPRASLVRWAEAAGAPRPSPSLWQRFREALPF